MGLTFNTHILIRHRWQDSNYLIFANVSLLSVYRNVVICWTWQNIFLRWLDRRLRYSHLTNHPELRWLFASLRWNKVKIAFLQRFQRNKKILIFLSVWKVSLGSVTGSGRQIFTSPMRFWKWKRQFTIQIIWFAGCQWCDVSKQGLRLPDHYLKWRGPLEIIFTKNRVKGRCFKPFSAISVTEKTKMKGLNTV